jgi:tetratricopeptide (TPR) repeat protein
LAKDARDPEKLKRDVDGMLAAKYHSLAETRRRRADHEAAIRFYSAALEHNSRSVEALRGRASSFDALGRRQEAAADLARATELNDDQR